MKLLSIIVAGTFAALASAAATPLEQRACVASKSNIPPPIFCNNEKHSREK